jgi:hypothetical protein
MGRVPLPPPGSRAFYEALEKRLRTEGLQTVMLVISAAALLVVVFVAAIKGLLG